MTSNLTVQNIKTDNAIDSLLSMEINTFTPTKNNNEFSYLMNSANAKVETTKSDFISKAKKTNTSNVNQKALSANNANEKVSKKEIENYSKKQTNKTDLNKKEVSSKSDLSAPIQDSEEVSKNEPTQTTQTKKEETNDDLADTQQIVNPDLSDINNSSFVDPSPVFSTLANNDGNQETTIETSEINNDLSVDKVISDVVELLNDSDIEGAKEKISDLISNVDNLDELKALGAKIVQAIDNANLSDEFSDGLSKTLNTLISSLKENASKSDVSLDFSKIQNEIKTNLENLLNSSKTNNDKVLELNNKVEDLISNVKDKLETFDNASLKETLSNYLTELKNKIEQTQNSEKLTDEEFSALIKKVDELINKISNEVSKNAIIAENSDNLESIKTLIDDFSSEIKNLASKENTNIKNIDTKFSFEIDENKINPDFQNAISKIAQKLENIDVDKLKNLSSDDKKALKAMLDSFKDNADIQDKIPTDEIKEQLNTLLDNLAKVSSNAQDNTTINENFVAQTDVDTQDIELSNNKDNNIKVDDLKLEKNNIENTQEFSDELSQNSSDEKNQSKENSNAQNEDNVLELKENLSKLASISETIDEMLLQSAPVVSESALSVVDEVARLAIENTSEIKGVNQTSPLNSNIIDMNSALVSKTIQEKPMINANQSFSEIMSNKINNSNVLAQITDKIIQTRDGSQKLTMVLRPFDLGRLQIELTSNRNGLTTNIIAQNEDVRNYIEKNIDALRQQLNESGVNVNNIQIKVAGQEGSTTYSGQDFSNNENLNQNSNNQNHNQKHQNEKTNAQMLATQLGYDNHLAKDFSSILNNAINYALN